MDTQIPFLTIADTVISQNVYIFPESSSKGIFFYTTALRHFGKVKFTLEWAMDA
jgi:hypothetical protein